MLLSSKSFVRSVRHVGAFAACFLFSLAAHANECLICDDQVVLDSKLASCFLSRYDILATRQAGAVVVDLTDCPEPDDVPGTDEEQQRGVVEALKMPEAPVGTPVPTFMITRSQLVCLKERLEDEALSLDPAARIPLDDCG